jgi:hypothetical protein
MTGGSRRDVVDGVDLVELPFSGTDGVEMAFGSVFGTAFGVTFDCDINAVSTE